MKAKDLKNSILQMAVEGKLVPQDPNDEPASVLLERIREEKQRLVAEGKAKFPKGGESIIYTGSDGSPYEKRVDAKGRVLSEKCIADEIPFEELPEGWAWARLAEVAFVLNGDRGKNYPAKSKLHDSGIPFVSAVNIEQGIVSKTNMLYMTETQYSMLRAGKLKQGDTVFCIRGSLGKHGIFPFERGAIASSLVIVRLIACAKMLPNYLDILFDSPTTKDNIKKFDNGTAQPNLSANNFQSFLYPVPPLAEQRRIVERVNELMPLVEEYGKLEDAREGLDSALPGRLRKSVLQMAVQGKLVPQDPSDEPASELLKRIREQRRQFIAEKKMKAPKGGESVIFAGSDGRRYEKRIDAKGGESEPICIEDEIPFDVPDNWEWARLETVATYIQRGKSPKYSSIEEYPVVAQKCNQWSGFSLEKAKFIDPDTVCKYGNERILQDGDLLWNSTGLGTLGRMAIYGSSKNKYGWAVADSHVTVIRTHENWFDYRFAFAYFAGPSVQSVIEEQASGSTKQKELAQETVKNYLIPIPSLAEQRRIVAQLEAVLPRITKQ